MNPPLLESFKLRNCSLGINRFSIGTLQYGSYILALGDTDYEGQNGENNATYTVEIFCSDAKTQSKSSSAPIMETKFLIILIMFVLSCLLLSVIIYYHCSKKLCKIYYKYIQINFSQF